MYVRTMVCGMVLAICAAGSRANEPAPEPAGQMMSPMVLVQAAMQGSASPGEKEPFPKFEEVTKDLESHEGLFVLWYYPPSAKDKDQQKLLCQIPKEFLGQNFMLSTSFSGGGLYTGFPLEERVVQWEALEKELVLLEPESRFVVNEDAPVGDVVRRTYPERIRTSVDIITKNKDGDPLIDLGALLKSNFADVAWMSFGQGGMVNPSLSKWTKRKTFELNVEIGVELAVSRMTPPGSYDKRLVHFSFWKLPQTDYRPRIADDRVGYFVTANQDWSKPHDARDNFNRYIDRWHLQKREPGLAVCEPKKPVVYYIEKTVPVRFRRAVRDGILEWNKAFEAIGLVNAIEVRQQTHDNEWKDLDPEDMRYSFFRWIVTGFGFAMGPHRANPFTGQIYDADIIFDDSMVRFFEREARQMLPTAALVRRDADPALRDFLDHHPQWKRTMPDWTGFMIGEAEDDEFRTAIRNHFHQDRLHRCDYAEGMRHQLAVARAVLAGEPEEIIDRLLYESIKETVMHEVGHTLGLRHNFMASTVYTLDDIKQRRQKDEPLVGSVMDYNPLILFEGMSTEGHFMTPTIGPYDYWAIEYGYKPVDGTPAKTAEGPAASSTSADAGPPAGAAAESSDSKGLALGGTPIPQELLDRLPPEAREILEARAKEEGAGTPPTAPSPAKVAFTGPDAAENEMLNAIASRAAEPLLAYASDEDSTLLGPDPRSNLFDCGADPIDWARARIELIDQRMANILEWGVKEGESWYHLRDAFLSLLVEKTFVLDYVGRYVGGLYTTRSHRGDPSAPTPFQPVPAALQREALTFIEQNLFTDRFFDFPADLLNHLAAPRWWHTGSYVDFRVDFPLRDLVGLLQWWNLFERMFPNTLRRIHDAELRFTDGDRFTAAEYLRRLESGCWSEVASADRAVGGNWSDAAPYVTDIRRSLQREYLGLAEPLVRIAPGRVLSPDLHAMIQQSLRSLMGRIDQVLATGKLDFASAAHLTACRSRIDRMLEPKLEEF